MRNMQQWFLVLFAFSISLLFAMPASAQATRTWVSGVGDDANPCSRTAPCKTFPGAISKTASGGEINVLDPGGFGSVTITKAITIDGGGSLSGVLVAGTNGIVVNAGVNDTVVLRNLDIDGGPISSNSQSGINFIQGKQLIAENVKIYGFTNSSGGAINVVPATAPTSGIVGLTVSNSTITNNSTRGIVISPTNGILINATIDGVTMAYNGRGLHATSGANVTVRNSTIANNITYGIDSIGTSSLAVINIDNSTIAYNGFPDGSYAGVFASGPSGIVNLSNTTVTGNAVGTKVVNGGTINSYGNNRVYGNSGISSPLVPISLQ